MQFLSTVSYGSSDIFVDYEIHIFLFVFVWLDDYNRITFVSFRNCSTIIMFFFHLVFDLLFGTVDVL
jgi:hypothetical protein